MEAANKGILATGGDVGRAFGPIVDAAQMISGAMDYLETGSSENWENACAGVALSFFAGLAVAVAIPASVGLFGAAVIVGVAAGVGSVLGGMFFQDFKEWLLSGDLFGRGVDLIGGLISKFLLSNPDPLVKDIKYVWVDPLVLDLDGDGLEISPLARGVQFDTNGDSIRTATAWVQADDGLLALDRNGNGAIDSGRELFGDETLLADGKKAAHGFAALAELDVGGAANATGGAGDGVFDAKDAQFTNVRVWRDLNQDGISQANELQTLTDAGIASVKLASTKTDTSYGDAQLVQSGSFTRADGTEGQAGSFILAQNNAVTTHAPIAISAAAAALPAIQGSGWVRGIQEAATLKPQLLSLFSNVQGAGTRAGFSGSISDLLLEWGNESDHITASEEALEEEDIGLILRKPVTEQEISWMHVAIKADKETREAFRSTLSRPDRELFDSMRSSMVGQLEKLYAYEAFTGYTFLSWPTLRLKEGPPPESLRTGRPVPSWVPLSEIMKIDAYAEWANVPGYKVVVIPPPEGGGKSHIDMLWDRLVEDATRNLLPSLRLSEYADKVQLTVSDTGVGIDFSQLNAALDAASAANAQEGATLFLDMYRTYGDVFRSAGWDGVDKLRGLMQAATGNPAIRAAFGTAGLNLVTASTQGTVNDDIFSGDAGEDTFHAGAGDDFLAGGAGGDDLQGDMGNDILLGEGGNDWMYGDDGNDVLEGGDGNDVMEGGAGDDMLLGGLGNDLMRGYTGNDTLDGQEGDDNLDASYGDDVLLGGQGNDNLDGGHGNDTLDGGLGNDSYTGGLGNNIYLFGKGDGKDVITASYGNTPGRVNVLRFKAGISPSELTATRSYEALVLSINGTTDQMTVSNFFQYNSHENPNNPLQEVHFEDGTVWTAAAMAAMTRAGTEGNDALGGTNDADVMDGLGGNDRLFGGLGDDTLLGGTGNDALFGEEGDDRLEGQDGDDNLDGSYGNDLLLGGVGNDGLNGGHGNDTLDGGLGSDSYSGGLGNNTYLFGKGDGKDGIQSSHDTTASRLNVLRFKAGIAPSEIRVSRAYESLVLSIDGTDDQVTVSYFFYNNAPENGYNPLQEVHFEDGTVWNTAAIVAQMEAQRPKSSQLGSSEGAGTPAQQALSYADPQAMAAALKPYQLPASSLLRDDLVVYGSGNSATLDSQAQQLLSAMASFAPEPGLQTKGFGDTSLWRLDNPLVAANTP